MRATVLIFYKKIVKKKKKDPTCTYIVGSVKVRILFLREG